MQKIYIEKINNTKLFSRKIKMEQDNLKISYNLEKEKNIRKLIHKLLQNNIEAVVISKDLYKNEKLINYLKKRIIDSNILKILFPSDFTIPELQKVYEQLLDIQIDRRNFRKRILNSGYIVSTGDVNEGNMGRPAKLYRFNDNKEEGNIF